MPKRLHEHYEDFDPENGRRDSYFGHTRAFFALESGQVHIGKPGESHEKLSARLRLPDVAWMGKRGYYMIPFRTLVWWSSLGSRDLYFSPSFREAVANEFRLKGYPVDNVAGDLQFMFSEIKKLPASSKMPHMTMKNAAVADWQNRAATKERYRAMLYGPSGLRKESIDMTREELIEAAREFLESVRPYFKGKGAIAGPVNRGMLGLVGHAINDVNRKSAAMFRGPKRNRLHGTTMGNLKHELAVRRKRRGKSITRREYRDVVKDYTRYGGHGIPGVW